MAWGEERTHVAAKSRPRALQLTVGAPFQSYELTLGTPFQRGGRSAPMLRREVGLVLFLLTAPAFGYEAGYGYCLSPYGAAYRRALRTTRTRLAAKSRPRALPADCSCFRVSSFGFRFSVKGGGCSVRVFRVWNFGFRVQVVGLRVRIFGAWGVW